MQTVELAQFTLVGVSGPKLNVVPPGAVLKFVPLMAVGDALFSVADRSFSVEENRSDYLGQIVAHHVIIVRNVQGHPVFTAVTG